MVLLSDVQGLYNGDPSLPESKLVNRCLESMKVFMAWSATNSRV